MGATGWDHDAWSGTFYPEELPVEWRLAFYNTIFTAAYVPYEQWAGTPKETLAGWANDVLDRFRFVLEAGSDGLTEADDERLAVLVDRLGLVVDRQGQVLSGQGHVWFLDRPLDLKSLAARLQGHASGEGAIYLISREGDLAAMEQAKTLAEMLGC